MRFGMTKFWSLIGLHFLSYETNRLLLNSLWWLKMIPVFHCLYSEEILWRLPTTLRCCSPCPYLPSFSGPVSHGWCCWWSRSYCPLHGFTQTWKQLLSGFCFLFINPMPLRPLSLQGCFNPVTSLVKHRALESVHTLILPALSHSFIATCSCHLCLLPHLTPPSLGLVRWLPLRHGCSKTISQVIDACG